jgi:hypothetical protein
VEDTAWDFVFIKIFLRERDRELTKASMSNKWRTTILQW